MGGVGVRRFFLQRNPANHHGTPESRNPPRLRQPAQSTTPPTRAAADPPPRPPLVAGAWGQGGVARRPAGDGAGAAGPHAAAAAAGAAVGGAGVPGVPGPPAGRCARRACRGGGAWVRCRPPRGVHLSVRNIHGAKNSPEIQNGLGGGGWVFTSKIMRDYGDYGVIRPNYPSVQMIQKYCNRNRNWKAAASNAFLGVFFLLHFPPK